MSRPTPGPEARSASTTRLGFGRSVGYGVGDFGLNLFFTTAGLFLLFYYTDVLGLSPSTAGWVFAGALIWDAVFDPLMGYLANRTRSRWGRYRPYLLFGAIPLAAAWALMFLPTGLAGPALILFAAGTHILFRTFYAIVGMPYLALSAVLTQDSKERGVIAAVRMIAGASCGLLSALLTLTLVKAFGGGQVGFFGMALVYGTLAAAVLMLVFASTREQISETVEQKVSLGDMVRMLRGNYAFWVVSAAMLLSAVGSTFFQKTVPYFFKYQLHREDLIGPALGLLAGCVMLSIPLWTWLMKRTSKRIMWITGAGISTLGFGLLWFAPAEPRAVLSVLPLLGVGAGAGYLGFWSMMPDTVEYGEWRSGVRAEGAIFGLVSLLQKGGLGLAAAGLGELLTVIGYQPNLAQTPETLSAMRVVMIASPAVLSLAAAAAIAFYGIDHRQHGRMVRALDRRRSKFSNGHDR